MSGRHGLLGASALLAMPMPLYFTGQPFLDANGVQRSPSFFRSADQGPLKRE